MKNPHKAAPKAGRAAATRSKSPPKARHSAQPPRTAIVAQQQPPSRTTKAAQVLAALHQPEGASLAELMQATGWQAHSVRGFLSGTVRKRLGRTLQAELLNGERRYRVEKPA